MSDQSSTYRAYCVDGFGRFTAAEWIEAESDDEALEIARGLDHPVGTEVWQGSRLVGRLSRPNP